MTTFQSKLYQLTSSSLDVTSKSTRNALLSSITSLLVLQPQQDDDDDDESSACSEHPRKLLRHGNLALKAIQKCSTIHSYKRLLTVLQVAIIAELEDDNNNDNLHSLCYAVCALLSTVQDTSLLTDCLTFLTQRVKSLDANSNDDNIIMVLYDEFVSIAKDGDGGGGGGKKVNDEYYDGIVYPALSWHHR